MKIFATVSFLFALLFLSSCQKEVSNEFPFVVKIVNSDGIPLSNISVRATADVPNAIPNFTGQTDVEGEVRFEYDRLAVLKIQATRGNPVTWIGCAFVRLEEGREVQKTLVLQPFDPSVGGC
jgi:hypothetical protein